MLVLTRRSEESIKIGDDIEIKVFEIKPKSVRLGIIAPKEVSVYRKEIYEIIQKENIRASKTEKQALKQLGKILKKNN